MAVTDSNSQAEAKPDSMAASAQAGTGLSMLKRFLTLREGSIIVVTIITLIYFGVSTPGFFKTGNFNTLLPFFAPFAILAAGQVFVMTLGEIDLSIGAMYLFVPFLFYKITNAGLPLIPSLIITLIVALGLGALNGFFVAYVGIASFVATLGMLFVLSGVTLVISHSEQVNMPGTSVTGTTTFSSIFGAGTDSELLWAIGIVAALQILLSLTRWGLYTVAAGGNRLGASEAGVNTKLVVVRNFSLCALTAGFVGILEAVRSASATPDPSVSGDILFQAVSAVIIGGTLMTGGEGTVVGAFIGAFFLGLLHFGLVLKGVSANYLNLYLGLAILIAMTVNVYVHRVRRGSGL